ncbi:phosphopantetheine-binding protein [uncultured Gimesia sp.]|mgnify:CR=1 FL=1|uniref:acyl carrier protein n=1 Tax=uncultured Gimesia sp. TaxID=1678688 RepID=UPI00261363B5|nr:phosphopantetheine-binding protein [uncultured Gimesia sp.]
MKTQDKIIRKIRKILAEEMSQSMDKDAVAAMQEDVKISQELGFDSLDHVDLFLEIETVFKIKFSDVEFSTIQTGPFTLQTLADFVLEKKQSRLPK